MTVIVAASWEGQAWIGCDQAGTDYWDTQGNRGTKLYKAPFGWIGYAGSFRTLQAIHRRLRAVTQIVTDEDMESLIREIETGLEEAGWSRSKADGLPQCEDLNLLLVTTAGQIWRVQSDLAYLRIPEFGSIGSGYQVALGAMHASRAARDDAETGAQRGLLAACEIIASCAYPAPLQRVGSESMFDGGGA